MSADFRSLELRERIIREPLRSPTRDSEHRLAATRTFLWRSLLKIEHVPEQMTDVVAVPLIFTLLFTYLFGGALASSPHEYLQFLLPGTLVMTVVLLTMYSGIILNTDFERGVFDRYRTLPIWRPAPIVGSLLGDIGRYLLASAIVLGLGLALGYRPAGGAVGVLAGIALVVVFAFSLSWLWTLIGLKMRSPSAVMSTGLLVQFPLTIASNVFVQPKTMPGWAQAFVNANPVSHLVTAERALMNGDAAGNEVGWMLLASVLLVAVFGTLTMRAYGRKQ